jgi:hypothetical protein
MRGLGIETGCGPMMETLDALYAVNKLFPDNSRHALEVTRLTDDRQGGLSGWGVYPRHRVIPPNRRALESI